jgi:hypothetical protein
MARFSQGDHMSVEPLDIDEAFPATADPEEIRCFGELLLLPDAVVEMRALHAPKSGTVSGYFDDEHLDQLVGWCEEYSGRAEGIYFTLNPVNRNLLARAANRAKPWAHHTTSDADILSRRWFPLDFDPIRPSGISSTDPEHEAAIQRAIECREWLRGKRFPEPSMVLGDSGNGAHLLVRVNLPNDNASRELVEGCIEAVALHFSDDIVGVDSTTANAARIWKCYGTLAAKGDDVPDRPHRLARLLEVPAKVRAMKPDLLHKLAALVPTPPAPASSGFRPVRGSSNFDLPAWIAEHELPVKQEKPWKGGRLWILNPCPWNPTHGNHSAFLIQHASGAIAAGCHHDGCTGKDWHALRDRYEPGWRERQGGRAQLTEGLPPAIAREFHNSSARRRRS